MIKRLLIAGFAAFVLLIPGVILFLVCIKTVAVLKEWKAVPEKTERPVQNKSLGKFGARSKPGGLARNCGYPG